MPSRSADPPAPPVFVVVLNWNGWADTIACLESLREQSYPALTAVVVDNGSSDDSVARIREAAPEAVLLETGANLGFAGGCNVGIRHALERGAAYVWLLNNDTLVEPDALAAMVRKAEARPRLGLVGSVLRDAEAPHAIQLWGGGTVHWWAGIPVSCRSAEEAERAEYLSGASLLIRRAVLEEVGLLDEGFFFYWEDVDYSLRARAAGWRLGVAEESVVLHKGGGTASAGESGPSLWAERQHLRGLARLLRRHRRLWPAPLLLRALLEVPTKLWRGQADRIVPILREVAAGLRRGRSASPE